MERFEAARSLAVAGLGFLLVSGCYLRPDYWPRTYYPLTQKHHVVATPDTLDCTPDKVLIKGKPFDEVLSLCGPPDMVTVPSNPDERVITYCSSPGKKRCDRGTVYYTLHFRKDRLRYWIAY